jgi:hypothetical protein
VGRCHRQPSRSDIKPDSGTTHQPKASP